MSSNQNQNNKNNCGYRCNTRIYWDIAINEY